MGLLGSVYVAGYCQGGSLSFTTNVDGYVTVDYENVAQQSAKRFAPGARTTAAPIAVRAGKMTVNGAADMRIHRIRFTTENPTPTAITNITTEPTPGVYTLSGQRVNGTPAPGIYIKGGQKVVVR